MDCNERDRWEAGHWQGDDGLSKGFSLFKNIDERWGSGSLPTKKTNECWGWGYHQEPRPRDTASLYAQAFQWGLRN